MWTEQLIVSVTGHPSIDGVRAYKRVLDNQKQQLSKHLQAKVCNKENIPDVENEPVSSVKPLASVVQPVMEPQSPPVQQPVQQPIIPQHPVLSQHPVLNIQGCSSVVINCW